MELTTEWLTAQVESKHRRLNGARADVTARTRRYLSCTDPVVSEIYRSLVVEALRLATEAEDEFAAAVARLHEVERHAHGPALPFEAVQ
jgi:hypothetical protein